MTIDSKIIDLVKELSCVDYVTRDSDLIHNLHLDSIERAEIVMELEKVFNIVISDDEMSDIKTVQDAIDTVKGKVIR